MKNEIISRRETRDDNSAARTITRITEMLAPMRIEFVIVTKIAFTIQSAIVKILRCVKYQILPGLCGGVP